MSEENKVVIVGMSEEDIQKAAKSLADSIDESIIEAIKKVYNENRADN